jgi:iron complex transport system ATP-binding protein
MGSLETRNLCGGYAHNTVFSGFDLSIPSAKFVALTGPNGSGKSTLLKYFFRQLKPQTGAVYIADKDVGNLAQNQIARLLGFVPQNGKIEYGFTVREAVAMGRYVFGGEDNDHAVDRAMEDCDILALADKRVTQISGGEMQRVLLARALCQETGTLLLDEPVNHLDVKHQRKMMNLLRHLVDHRGMSVVCVLHDLLLVQVYSDEVILLQKGVVRAEGPVKEVVTKEHLLEVYGVRSHEVFDTMLDRYLLMPTWF